MGRSTGTSSSLYQDDKEKRDLVKARTADLTSKTAQREDNRYYRSKGFPDRAAMTEAENSSEKRATNSRLVDNAATNSKIEALKAMAASDPGGPHGKAALDELAKTAGVKVQKTVDPKQAAMNKLRAAKGLPPIGGEEEPQTAQPEQPQQPQQDQSLFQPQAYSDDSGLVQQPEAPREASYGNPITPHLGTGGGEVTPANPTGNKSDPWGPGGLFETNPTHLAAQNVNAREAAAHPYGSDNGPISQTYFPGEAVDRLAGGSQPRPQAQPQARPQGNQLPPPPGGTTLVSNPAATVPVPSTPSFDTNNLVQPQAGPRTPPNVNVDLDALASHIGNWFSSQANQVQKKTNY